MGSQVLLCITICVAAQPLRAQPATRAATAPATQAATVTVVHLAGIVQARQTENDLWATPQVGQVFNEGVEFRTGTRSQVTLRIPPDQEVTLDRLTTLRILRATISGEAAQTDLGMRYGRTQYDVEQAGFRHEATIRSPGATIAVRGTESMLLFDHGPFAPQAIAWQPVEFRNLRRQAIRFGRAGRRARIEGDKNSPAETEIAATDVDPRTPFSGRTGNEDALAQYLANFPGVDLKNLGVFGILARDKTFAGSISGVLPIPDQLRFVLIWTAPPGTDVNMSVRSPKGEVVSIANPIVKSGGRHLGDGVANKQGFGQETVIWDAFFPPGRYTVRGRLRDTTGEASANARLFVDKNPLDKKTQRLDDFSVTLTPAQLTFRRDVKAR